MIDLGYRLFASWDSREEHPAQLADRFLRMIEAFSRIGHPLLKDWDFYCPPSDPEVPRPVIGALTRDKLIGLIADGVNNAETDGEPIPEWGYLWFVGTKEPSSPHSIMADIHAGGTTDQPRRPNWCDFWTAPLSPENASLLTFPVMRAVLQGIVAAWEPSWASLSYAGYNERWARAEPWNDEQAKLKRPDGYLPPFKSGWMTYLCADYARRISPPPDIDVEQVAGGGLLMVATRDTFIPGNPAHDAAADAIQKALLPLQSMPYL